jgi:hypothetical protein
LINIFFLLCGHIISYSAAYSNHPLLLSSSLYYLVSDGVSVEEETENNNPLGFKSIKKFTSDGKFITSWGSEGDGDGQFLRPEDVAIDSSSDNVYVVDSGNVHEKKDVCALVFHLLAWIINCLRFYAKKYAFVLNVVTV